MPRNRMFLLGVKSVGLVDNGACGAEPGQGGADIVLFKRRSIETMSDKAKATAAKSDETAAEPTVNPELDAANARIAELEAANAALLADAEAAKAAKPAEPTEDDVLKNADPAVVAIIEKQRRAAEAAEKRAEEAAKIAEAERDKREAREWVEKASAYKALPVKADELGAALRVVAAAATEEQFATIEKALKAGDVALAESFKERGRGRNADDESAVAEVTKRAQALLAEKQSPTIEQAKVKVRQADRELAAREAAELRGK